MWNLMRSRARCCIKLYGCTTVAAVSGYLLSAPSRIKCISAVEALRTGHYRVWFDWSSGQIFYYLDRVQSVTYIPPVWCQTLAAVFPEVKQTKPETDPTTVSSNKAESAWKSAFATACSFIIWYLIKPFKTAINLDYVLSAVQKSPDWIFYRFPTNAIYRAAIELRSWSRFSQECKLALV
jgi:hypothetical protein